MLSMSLCITKPTSYIFKFLELPFSVCVYCIINITCTKVVLNLVIGFQNLQGRAGGVKGTYIHGFVVMDKIIHFHQFFNTLLNIFRGLE